MFSVACAVKAGKRWGLLFTNRCEEEERQEVGIANCGKNRYVLFRMRYFVVGVLFVGVVAWLVSLTMLKGEESKSKGRAERVARKVTPRLKRELAAKGLNFGDAVFIRIFKEERELELWIEKGERFEKFRTYRIAGMSGKLGPKLAEGDRQAPEGFYFVPRSMMNPQSLYHLAFNIGFPNSYDKGKDRTGSFIMVHGDTLSIGCFAMTDSKIEEIYTLCDAALMNGQPYFRVHSFPFRMTSERMTKARGKKWEPFWKELKPGYDWFEEKKWPPNVEFKEGRYQFN